MPSRLRLLALALVAACAGSPRPTSPTPAAGAGGPKLDASSEWVDPTDFARVGTARPPRPRPAGPPVVIRHATILTAAGTRIDDGAIVLEDGKISALGAADLPAPAGAVEIDGKGRFVTPGLIDSHSHIGVYRVPHIAATGDGNEASAVATPSAAAEYAYDAQDPAIARAAAGGVTTALILPGSANLIGGRGVAVEMRRGAGIDDVRFPGAPAVLKMACGENPKRSHGGKGGPMTRMGEYAAVRALFQAAAEYDGARARYKQKRAEWEARRARARELNEAAAREGKPGRVAAEAAPEPPAEDAAKEVLAAVLRGDILAQVHCYTSHDMLQMLAIADELGFKIRSFHHSLEAYKIRDRVVAHGAAIATWADWWGFKLEAFDGIPENAALFAESGGRVSIHSDSGIGIQRLNQEAAKAMAAGRAAGIDVSEDKALRWITVEPAWILGIDAMTGSLEVGKRADVVLWSAHPFSTYALPDQVFIAGVKVHDRAEGKPASDFELGNSSLGQGGAK